jgi:hypothetical protein
MTAMVLPLTLCINQLAMAVYRIAINYRNDIPIYSLVGHLAEKKLQ